MRDENGRFVEGHTAINPFDKGNTVRNTGRTRFQNGSEPWNKGTKGVMPEAWNKGKSNPLFQGENNPNWKGGISDKNRSIRKSNEYKEWRLKVYARDHYACQDCGYKGKDIIAHHIEGFAEVPEKRFNVDNGRTLCRPCHIKIHQPQKKQLTRGRKIMRNNSRRVV